jgi:short subunit dehydrogenase-like uncharacterized protein
MSTIEHDRPYDIVVFGATGFVGALTAAYLVDAAPEGARIALAGRSLEKLEQTRAGLGARAADWPLVLAESHEADAIAGLAHSTRVVATTVGPYHRYGLPLVEACAAAGTHYADLTGEVLFMRRSIDAAQDAAVASGARIVHTCGFDSIPSDLGVFLLHEYAREHGHGDLEDTTLVVTAMRGGVSGGTIDSMRGQLDEAKAHKESRRIMGDPYSLSPDRTHEPSTGTERDPMGITYDADLGGWLAPFVMGTVNSRVVRRSNALQGWAYGRRLRYRELMLGGDLPLGPVKAGAIAGGIAGLVVGLSVPPTRALLDKVLPEPGEGPSEEQRDKGMFRIEVHTRTSTGDHLVCRIAASGDPGYKATGVMLGESALALAFDGDRLPAAAGVLTPSTAMGHVLADRLRAAGHTYEVAPA